MNPFQQHGITHVSPSSLNLFASQPALWCLQKLAKVSTAVGPAAHRGTASETGIVHGLLNPDASIKECQDIAIKQFNDLTAFDFDPKVEKEAAAVPAIVEQGIKKLRPFGIPDEVQHKVLINLPGVAVPFMGFIDVGWSDKKIRLDIKTQLRLSSEISESHARQVSLYIHGTQCAGKVAYITPKACEIYDLTDMANHLESLRQIAIRMQNFLGLTADRDRLLAAVVPDYGSFYWSDAATRAAGKKVFGI